MTEIKKAYFRPEDDPEVIELRRRISEQINAPNPFIEALLDVMLKIINDMEEKKGQK